jgi:hypothetical protein
MKPKKTYYRDDQVIVENPEILIRVGYTLGINEGVKYVLENHEKEIRDLFKKVTGTIGLDGSVGDILAGNRWNSRQFDNVVRALAYQWIDHQGFGGPERKLHTKLIEELRGRQLRVVGRKKAVTGIRSPGYQSSDPEGDSYPPYLENQKVHTLIELDIPFFPESASDYIDLVSLIDRPDCWIDAVNVRKVYDSTSNTWLEGPDAPAAEEVPWVQPSAESMLGTETGADNPVQ